MHIKTCENFFYRIYGLQEKCKNMVIRFQSPIVYIDLFSFLRILFIFFLWGGGGGLVGAA